MPKVNLIDITSYSYNIENIGLEYIASYLREKLVEVKLSTLNSDKPIEDSVHDIDLKYDLFGFSTFYTNIDIIFSAAKYIKTMKPDSKIFLGGRFASAAPNRILSDCEYIDFIILGDGEYPMLDVVNAIRNNHDIDELPSVVTRNTKHKKKPSIVKFHELKWPSRDLLEKCINRNLFSARLLASRGCSANCTFCCHNSYTKVANTEQWVGRNMTDVYNELISLYETYNITTFFFNDGSFKDSDELGKQRILQLCNLILSQPVKFVFHIFVRAESFTEKDIGLLKIMRKAGFYFVFIGIESVNENDLRIFNKNATAQINRTAYDLFQKQGFNVNIGFIMINPWSTRLSISENFDFLCDVKFNNTVAYISKLQIYYDSSIYRRLEKHNMLTPNSSYCDIYNYSFVDPFIKELDELIGKLFKNDMFLKKERDYIVFNNAFSELDYSFPEKTHKYRNKISAINEKYFYLLRDYFAIIYKDYDLKMAENRYTEFTEKARAVLKKFNQLKYKIIADKNLYSHFIRINNEQP